MLQSTSDIAERFLEEERMKIGIISINMYSKGLNFACPLHNYAFQQFLMKNGIESTIISYKPIYFNNFNLRHPYDYYVKLCDQFLKSGRDKTEPEEWERRTSLRDAWKELYEERERRYDKFQNFIESNYIKTKECYDSDRLEVMDPGFDCYICCTDVIWKKEPNVGFDRGFFLASRAMENKWKISYAASRGVFFSENEEDEQQFLHYVKDIDAISVREESLHDYLKENIDNEVTMVVDPVLLHEKEFYDKILIKPEEEHYIFLYYVMEKAKDTIEQAVKYARANNLKIVEITDRPVKDGRLSEYEDIEKIYNYDMGIEEWLGYIKYADCVFTNSFHACCFSILFEKQFFVGSRNGDKVTHVLEMFGLSDRRVNKDSDIITVPMPDIDYNKVRGLLSLERQKSSDFILSAIHRMEKIKRPEKEYDEWKKKIKYNIYYNSGAYLNINADGYETYEGNLKKLSSGSWEYLSADIMTNDGNSRLRKNEFQRVGATFAGWRLRFKVDNRWFWYLKDGSFVLKSEYTKGHHPAIRKFKDCDTIPYIPVNQISLVVAEALWEEYTIIYNSGLYTSEMIWKFDETKGKIKKLKSGSVEYKLNHPIKNDGRTKLIKNGFEHPEFRFLGWKMRIKKDDKWYWYLSDGSLKLQETYREKRDGERYLLKDESKIPYIPANYVTTVVLEGVWKMGIKTKVARKIKKIRGQK